MKFRTKHRIIIYVQVAYGSRPVAAGVKRTYQGKFGLDNGKASREFTLLQRRNQDGGKSMADCDDTDS